MRLNLTISKEQQAEANQFFKDNIDREGGEFTFTVPTEDGLGFVMSGEFTEEQVDLITDYFEITV